MPLQGGGTDPWETGSYDLALEEARIEDFNIVAYTSVVPPEATEVPPMPAVSGGMLIRIEPVGSMGMDWGWSQGALWECSFPAHSAQQQSGLVELRRVAVHR